MKPFPSLQCPGSGQVPVFKWKKEFHVDQKIEEIEMFSALNTICINYHLWLWFLFLRSLLLLLLEKI